MSDFFDQWGAREVAGSGLLSGALVWAVREFIRNIGAHNAREDRLKEDLQQFAVEQVIQQTKDLRTSVNALSKENAALQQEVNTLRQSLMATQRVCFEVLEHASEANLQLITLAHAVESNDGTAGEFAQKSQRWVEDTKSLRQRWQSIINQLAGTANRPDGATNPPL